MDLFFYVIVLLQLSLATAANFTQVFEWPDGMDYEWPSEAKRTQALKDGIFKPEKIEPIFMAVYGTRIFLSLDKFSHVIPVTLVSLPTSSEYSASPKLTPFPSWDMHGKGGCNKIEQARGLQVDSVGRLWVLDSGSDYCNIKLLIFNLSNNHTKLRFFSFHFFVNNFVLDEMPNDTFAYIERWNQLNIVVFSLERSESWLVGTSGIVVSSIALSPKMEPRQLYLTKWHPHELYSISVDTLRNGTQIAFPKLIRKLNAVPYSMLIDNKGTLYAAYLNKNYINSWNSSQIFEDEHRFHEGEILDSILPFTFALDSSGTFWMTEIYETETKPRYRLLKAAVGAKSYIFETPSVWPVASITIPPKTKPTPIVGLLSIPTATTTKPESTPVTATASTQIHITTDIVGNSTQLRELNHTTPVNLSMPTTTKSSTPAEDTATSEVQKSSTSTENSNENRTIIINLICFNVFTVILSSSIIFWLILKLKKNHVTTLQKTNEGHEMSVLRDNYDAEESLVHYEEVTQPRPFHLIPTSSRFVSARDPSESDHWEAEESSKFEKSGTRSTFVFDDVGPAEPEHLYEEVEAVPYQVTSLRRFFFRDDTIPVNPAMNTFGEQFGS